MRGVYYSDDNPPRGGTAKKIFKAFKGAGFQVHDLHYNVALWGQAGVDGWGTWACTLRMPELFVGWCGWDGEDAYIEQNVAPYVRLAVSSLNLSKG